MLNILPTCFVVSFFGVSIIFLETMTAGIMPSLAWKSVLDLQESMLRTHLSCKVSQQRARTLALRPSHCVFCWDSRQLVRDPARFLAVCALGALARSWCGRPIFSACVLRKRLEQAFAGRDRCTDDLVLDSQSSPWGCKWTPNGFIWSEVLRNRVESSWYGPKKHNMTEPHQKKIQKLEPLSTNASG